LPSQVEILGQLSPAVSSLGGLPVHCFVGYIHSISSPQVTTTTITIDQLLDAKTPLPSITLSSLTPSPSEVSQIFHLPLSYLTDPKRLRIHKLPHKPPYYAIDVTDRVDAWKDIVFPAIPGSFEAVDLEKESGSDSDPADVHPTPKVQVWGLTGWYINEFMRCLDVY